MTRRSEGRSDKGMLELRVPLQGSYLGENDPQSYLVPFHPLTFGPRLMKVLANQGEAQVQGPRVQVVLSGELNEPVEEDGEHGRGQVGMVVEVGMGWKRFGE